MNLNINDRLRLQQNAFTLKEVPQILLQLLSHRSVSNGTYTFSF